MKIMEDLTFLHIKYILKENYKFYKQICGNNNNNDNSESSSSIIKSRKYLDNLTFNQLFYQNPRIKIENLNKNKIIKFQKILKNKSGISNDGSASIGKQLPKIKSFKSAAAVARTTKYSNYTMKSNRTLRSEVRKQNEIIENQIKSKLDTFVTTTATMTDADEINLNENDDNMKTSLEVSVPIAPSIDLTQNINNYTTEENTSNIISGGSVDENPKTCFQMTAKNGISVSLTKENNENNDENTAINASQITMPNTNEMISDEISSRLLLNNAKQKKINSNSDIKSILRVETYPNRNKRININVEIKIPKSPEKKLNPGRYKLFLDMSNINFPPKQTNVIEANNEINSVESQKLENQLLTNDTTNNKGNNKRKLKINENNCNINNKKQKKQRKKKSDLVEYIEQFANDCNDHQSNTNLNLTSENDQQMENFQIDNVTSTTTMEKNRSISANVNHQIPLIEKDSTITFLTYNENGEWIRSVNHNPLETTSLDTVVDLNSTSVIPISSTSTVSNNQNQTDDTFMLPIDIEGDTMQLVDFFENNCESILKMVSNQNEKQKEEEQQQPIPSTSRADSFDKTFDQSLQNVPIGLNDNDLNVVLDLSCSKKNYNDNMTDVAVEEQTESIINLYNHVHDEILTDKLNDDNLNNMEKNKNTENIKTSSSQHVSVVETNEKQSNYTNNDQMNVSTRSETDLLTQSEIAKDMPLLDDYVTNENEKKNSIQNLNEVKSNETLEHENINLHVNENKETEVVGEEKKEDDDYDDAISLYANSICSSPGCEILESEMNCETECIDNLEKSSNDVSTKSTTFDNISISMNNSNYEKDHSKTQNDHNSVDRNRNDFFNSLTVDLQSPSKNIRNDHTTNFKNLDINLYNSNNKKLYVSKNYRIPKIKKSITDTATTVTSTSTSTTSTTITTDSNYSNEILFNDDRNIVPPSTALQTLPSLLQTPIPPPSSSLSFISCNSNRNRIFDTDTPQQLKRKVHTIFGNPCFSFLNDLCFSKHCKYNHNLIDEIYIKNKLMHLNQNILNTAYTFVVHNYKLFSKYFRIFCEIYSDRNDNKSKVHSMISDCSMYNNGYLFLKDIRNCLIKIGYIYTDAVRTIISIYSNNTQEAINTIIDMCIDYDPTQFIDILRFYSNKNEYHFEIDTIIKLIVVCNQTNNFELSSVVMNILTKIPNETLINHKNDDIVKFLSMVQKMNCE